MEKKTKIAPKQEALVNKRLKYARHGDKMKQLIVKLTFFLLRRLSVLWVTLPGPIEWKSWSQSLIDGRYAWLGADYELASRNILKVLWKINSKRNLETLASKQSWYIKTSSVINHQRGHFDRISALIQVLKGSSLLLDWNLSSVSTPYTSFNLWWPYSPCCLRS